MKNRGLTLIEVLTAVAIIGMVIIAVTGFINAGIKTSSRVNVEANLQKEAQTGLNQVADWVMSANHGIVVYGPYGSYYDQAVCIYHDGKNSEDRYVQILFYRKADCKVYYFKNQVTSSFYGNDRCGTISYNLYYLIGECFYGNREEVFSKTLTRQSLWV